MRLLLDSLPHRAVLWILLLLETTKAAPLSTFIPPPTTGVQSPTFHPIILPPGQTIHFQEPPPVSPMPQLSRKSGISGTTIAAIGGTAGLGLGGYGLYKYKLRRYPPDVRAAIGEMLDLAGNGVGTVGKAALGHYF